MIAASASLVIAGVALVLAAVAVLAGPWWAAGTAGLVLIYAGFVLSTHANARGGADELAATEAHR